MSQHSCKDCGVVFDSGKSLDVHLHYHKENLMSKWIQQATTSSEDNNNVKKNGRAGSSVAAPADSSEPYYQYQEPQYQENGGVSAFHRIRNFARYHPYQQQPAVSSSSAGQQCDKCGFVTDNMAEHIQQAHPVNFYQPYGPVKEEPQILDLDSQKVIPRGPEGVVYPPNGEEQPEQVLSPWDSTKYFEEKKEEQVPSPYYEDKEKKMFYEEKRFMLEENGNGSPDFGGVSTSCPEPAMQYYEPVAPKLPSLMKPMGGGASWKSNEARRPKTYNCTACNKWFTSSGHLKRHYNTTLHKNAVKQSGVMDPATMPISAHHHPPKEDESKPDPPPQAFPPAPYLHEEPFQPQDSFHYPQYPNALPPHVTNIGSDSKFYQTEPLPSFQQGFQAVFQDFTDVGGLYEPFQEFEEEMDEEPETIIPEPPTSTTETPIPTMLITEEPTSTVEPPKEQIHKCIDCDKTFNKACYLTQHNKSFHSGDKPYKCSRCGKRFTQEYLHLEHLSKHGGDKPHKCEMCPKQFNHKTDLRRHMCLHSGDKPFACDHCGKGFIRKDHMLKHAETHKRKQQQQSLLQQRGLFKKPQPRLLLDSNMNPTLQVQ